MFKRTPMFEPIKIGLAEFLRGFYESIVPTTKQMEPFVERGFGKSIAWAPARMADKAEEMLAAWQKNDTDQAATRPSKMPAILVAIAKDYTPISGDFGTQIADSTDFFIPGDPEQRYFEMRMVSGEIRAQLAIFAHEEETAKSLAAQFLLYLSSPSNRGFDANFKVIEGPSGDTTRDVYLPLPVQFEAPDNPAMNIETGVRNLTVLAVDLTLRCSIPLLKAPVIGQANDGKGTANDKVDPAGFPLASEFTSVESDQES